MLKNYTVKIQNVEVGKQNKLLSYLTDTRHKNHINSSIINATEVDEENYKLNLLKKLHQQELSYMKNAKGGRKLKRIAKTMIFNLPKDYEATAEQLKIINLKLLEGFKNLFEGLSIDLTEKDIFSVIHAEKEKQDHWHFILPMLDNNGKNIRHFNSPAFAKKVKVLFTEIVDATLNTDIKHYVPLTPEQQEHNAYLQDLERLKSDYTRMLSDSSITEKASNFIRNEIIKIDRTLKNNTPETIKDYMATINKGVAKVNKSNTLGNTSPLKI